MHVANISPLNVGALYSMPLAPLSMPVTASGVKAVHLSPLMHSTVRRAVACVPPGKFRFFAARQALPNWCWAACIQMVLNLHGVRVSQPEIVRQVFGIVGDIPATPGHILKALSGIGFVGDIPCRIEATHLTPGIKSVIADLVQEEPIIVGLANPGGAMGHVYVLTGFTFDECSCGEVRPLSASLYNPWPFSPDFEEMTWLEFQSRLRFLIRVRVTVL